MIGFLGGGWLLSSSLLLFVVVVVAVVNDISIISFPSMDILYIWKGSTGAAPTIKTSMRTSNVDGHRLGGETEETKKAPQYFEPEVTR